VETFTGNWFGSHFNWFVAQHKPITDFILSLDLAAYLVDYDPPSACNAKRLSTAWLSLRHSNDFSRLLAPGRAPHSLMD